MGSADAERPGGRRRKPALARLAFACFTLVSAALVAPATTAQSFGDPATPARFPTPESVRFDLLHRAERSQWFRATLVRTAVTRAAEPDAPLERARVVERLSMAPAPDPVPGDALGTENPPAPTDRGLPLFRLEHVETLDVALDDEQQRLRARLHARAAAFLFEHATLLVDDPAAAAANYDLVPIGTFERIGRVVQRVVVLPRNDLVGSAFVWDVDRRTGFPLYQAEYTADGVLIAALAATEFAHGEAVREAGAPDRGWWQPRSLVRDFPSVDALRAAFGEFEIHVPDNRLASAGFAPTTFRAVQSDLNDQVDIVLGYGDGIDEVVFVQTFGAPASGIDRILGTTSDTKTIQRYQDLQTVQLRFEVDRTHYLMVGRAGLSSPLRDWAVDVLRSLL